MTFHGEDGQRNHSISSSRLKRDFKMLGLSICEEKNRKKNEFVVEVKTICIQGYVNEMVEQ